MVMAQSLFKLLKQQDAQTHIDVLAPAWTFSLLERMPEVSQAIETPFAHGELSLRKRYQFAKRLRSSHYDQAIVLPHSFKSALIPWFAHIPKRTGWCGEFRYGVLNDIRPLDKKRYPLMVNQFMALGLPRDHALPEPIYPHFTISKTSQEVVLAKHQPLWRGRPILALCAGAEYGPAKRWPAPYYAQIANQKIKERWDIWLLGSQRDRAVTDAIMQMTQHQCGNLAGRPNLAETIDLLSLVDGVVTNDSGLMHVAAALNKPLIALYGPTSPAFTPPLSLHSHVLQLNLPCQPCFARNCPLQHHRCMQDLLPQQVLSIMQSWGA
jgi:heptosyltransferase-2